MNEHEYNFSLNDLSRLIEEIASYENDPEEFIRNRFERRSTNYDASLNFLIRLKLIKNKKDSLFLSPVLKKIEYPITLQQIIKDSLLRSRDFPDAHTFIMRFKPEDNIFIYKSTRSESFNESDIRNLLINLGVIKFNQSKDLYTIDPGSYNESFNQIRKTHRKLSLKAFKAIDANRQKIGSDAEIAALKYEQDRLHSVSDLVRRIKHTALIDVNAGYDIESFISPENEDRIFIEVKAVSPIDFKFQWTRNEIATSQLLSNRYFLYLIPVVNGKPNVSDIIVIKDPYKNVFKAKSEWTKSEKVYTIWKDQK